MSENTIKPCAYERRDVTTKWEKIDPNDGGTLRMKVDNGWIYKSVCSQGIALCFVPLPDKCEYHKQHRLYVCAECYEENKM